jgi:hypothetical protein
MTIFNSIGRMFTIPKKERQIIDNSPIVKAVLPVILKDGITAIELIVESNIKLSVEEKAAINVAINSALNQIIKV